jgi:hypothetical protein
MILPLSDAPNPGGRPYVTYALIALNVPFHEHHDVVGIDKPALKARIRALKKERDAAIEAGDHKKLDEVRAHIHRLNRQIRKHMV